MSRAQNLEDAIFAALSQHKDAAHLPLTEGHVRAQASVARRAAQAWSAQTGAQPALEFPLLRVRTYTPRRQPAADDVPPDGPTAVGAHCTRPSCEPIERAVGWRWYLADGWQPTCDRHMGGAPRATRRFNSEYLEDGSR